MSGNSPTGALARAHARFVALDGFAAYAAYLAAKDRGLKRDANQAAALFATQLCAAPLEAGVAQVRALDEGRRLFGDPPGLIPYPVAMAAADLCERWAAAEPDRAEPLLIRAGLQNDPSLIPEALAREPGDPRALKSETARMLGRASDALHHINKGRVIGDLCEVRAALGDVRALCARLGDADWSRAVLEDANLYDRVLDGLEAWRAAGEPGDFPAFMEARGIRLGDTPVYAFCG